MRRKTTVDNYESLASGVRSSIDLFVLAERRGWFWSGWLGLGCVVCALAGFGCQFVFRRKKRPRDGKNWSVRSGGAVVAQRLLTPHCPDREGAMGSARWRRVIGLIGPRWTPTLPNSV